VVNITAKGVDDVEGRSQEATPTTSFIFNAPVHSSVIGTHNPAELINNFDFSSMEERIEREGDADAEEPREALAVRYVISLKKAKRWIVAYRRGSARRCSATNGSPAVSCRPSCLCDSGFWVASRPPPPRPWEYSVFENCHGFGSHRQVYPSIASGRQISGCPRNGNLYFRGSSFPVV
jgi:hypothetical protein